MVKWNLPKFLLHRSKLHQSQFYVLNTMQETAYKSNIKYLDASTSSSEKQLFKNTSFEVYFSTGQHSSQKAELLHCFIFICETENPAHQTCKKHRGCLCILSVFKEQMIHKICLILKIASLGSFQLPPVWKIHFLLIFCTLYTEVGVERSLVQSIIKDKNERFFTILDRTKVTVQIITLAKQSNYCKISSGVQACGHQ